MKSFLDPDLIARTYRDPLAVAMLCVDFLPVLAVLAFGWGATPLVALYWLENLIIGLFTVFRMIATAVGTVSDRFMVFFVVPFFVLHYGMFCFGHGVFLHAFAGDGGGMPDYRSLIAWALGSGQGMMFFVMAILGMNAILFVSDFLLKGGYREGSLMGEMFAPYGRIVTLHVAIILGAALAFGTREPLLGVLLLIVLRVVFGVIVSALRQRRLDDAGVPAAKDSPAAT